MTPALSPAKSAEVAWQENDRKHRGWTAHLHVGSEVIKYHLPAQQSAADNELVSQVVQAALEDGYELRPEAVKIAR
jgi:hypothetical protein